jgi:carbon monoxide dehydrogenase subunit G
MRPNLTTRKTISIQTPAAKAWKAINNASSLKQMMFGGEEITDWVPGNEILFIVKD